MEKRYKKLSVDFPADEYVYLKMACAKKGVSLQDFVTQSIIRSIAEYEDELDLIAIGKISEDERNNAIPWKHVKRGI